MGSESPADDRARVVEAPERRAGGGAQLLRARLDSRAPRRAQREGSIADGVPQGPGLHTPRGVGRAKGQQVPGDIPKVNSGQTRKMIIQGVWGTAAPPAAGNTSLPPLDTSLSLF